MLSFNAFNPTSLLATAAFSPAGGLVAQLATRIFSQVGQQLIQQMGQNLGLPQSGIDLAQASFAGSHGDIQGFASNFREGLDGAIQDAGQQFGAPPVDIADQQRNIQDLLRQLVDQASDSNDFKQAKAGGRGQGWLMAMAKVLGSQLDKLGAQMESMAKRITKDTPGLSSEFTVVSQQFGMLMNAASTSLKTVGESMGRMASKQ